MPWLYINAKRAGHLPVLIGKVETRDISTSIDKLRKSLPKKRLVHVHQSIGDFTGEVTIF